MSAAANAEDLHRIGLAAGNDPDSGVRESHFEQFETRARRSDADGAGANG